MKTLIKYISLLLFSGLIIPVCYLLPLKTHPSSRKPTPLLTAQTIPAHVPAAGVILINAVVKNIFRH
ncbi:hypothetical protein SAMN05216464_109222 [Mucilaginibacter pineti]|uniref:Uncharacterized protein n=1 Tax=Mucilaginibacter pineti TaxID=1391627 RepID=A0A1G7FUG2_9SPHI|nr:hypothetical protein [Mucilaginibacter pineti]SDE79560.1 hypothetical protein SAMN05216464_109222 [Mucilaginibacter pineti]